MKLSPIERAALWKCWNAGMYDNLADKKKRPRGTPEEWAEVERASHVNTPVQVYSRLEKRGLIQRKPPPYSSCLRLTEKGRAMLQPGNTQEEKRGS